jgi:hypothetical protein
MQVVRSPHRAQGRQITLDGSRIGGEGGIARLGVPAHAEHHIAPVAIREDAHRIRDRLTGRQGHIMHEVRPTPTGPVVSAGLLIEAQMMLASTGERSNVCHATARRRMPSSSMSGAAVYGSRMFAQSTSFGQNSRPDATETP